MSKLIRGNELELAISVGTVLGNVPAHLRLATELLSRRCEHLGKWSVCVSVSWLKRSRRKHGVNDL